MKGTIRVKAEDVHRAKVLYPKSRGVGFTLRVLWSQAGL